MITTILLLFILVHADICPAGYICIGPQVIACPAGTYTNIGSGSSGLCTPCPSGYYCPNQMAAIPCPEATPYSDEGSATSATVAGCTNACAAGHYCFRDMPTPCDLGEVPSTDKLRCKPCTPGYYCPNHATETVAPTGTYTLGNAAYATPCAAGTYCSISNGAGIPCPSGYYSLPNSASCTICGTGNFCVDNFRSPSPCDLGYYAPVQGLTSCIEIPAGFYSNDYTAINPCNNGEYSLGHASSCRSCPAGYECRDKTKQPTVCPYGTYSLGGALSCTTCPKGQYCATLYQSPSNCAAGDYSLDGWIRCASCPMGLACTSNVLTVCTGGQFFNTASKLCENGPAGSMTRVSTETPVACPAGTYALSKWTYCVECSIGKKCSATQNASPTDCLAGSFEYNSGLSTSCDTVGNGYRYVSNSVLPIRCPPGYYQTSDKSTCTVSPSGSMSFDPKANPTSCSAGYFSAKGNAWCVPCPYGYVCPSQTSISKYICDIGTTSASLATTACVSCLAGKSCPTFQTSDVYNCPAGTYAPAGEGICLLCPSGYSCSSSGLGSPTLCNAGTMSTEGFKDVCAVCPLGKSCPFRFQILAEDCEYGYYNPTASSPNCVPCPAGKRCENREAATNCAANQYSIKGDPLCRDCPGGFECSTGVPLPCNRGTVSLDGANLCATCLQGTYCSKSSQYAIKCPPGYYADTTLSTICKHCSPGQYSVYGSNTCAVISQGYEATYFGGPQVQCSKGYYSDPLATGGWACVPCLPGKSCEAKAQTVPLTACASGYYCNTIEGPGILMSGIHPCPPGTYPRASPANTYYLYGSCQDCPAGSYCLGGNAAFAACPSGYYCPSRTRYAHEFPCPAGYKSKVVGLRDTLANSCQDCGSGSVCYEGTVSPFLCPPEFSCLNARTPVLSALWKCSEGKYNENNCDTTLGCGAGNFCPYGSYLPYKCPPGSYTDGKFAIRKEDCTLCTAGKACPYFGMISTDMVNCQDGYYCPSGTVTPNQYPIPQGNYQTTTGANIIIDTAATICPNGKACYDGTGPDTIEDCPLGYYCTGGQLNKASAGKYINVRGAAADGAACLAGYFCPEGTIYPVNECYEGFYCDSGTKRGDEKPCLAGTYSNKRGLKSSGDCTPCEKGYYCPLGSTAHFKCPIGTFNSNSGLDFAGCTPCTAGSMCPNEGMEAAIPCGKGYYAQTGSTKCNTCPKGYSCSSVTTATPTVCTAGKWCNTGTGDEIGCPVGSFCLGGVLIPQPCYPGTYRDTLGAASSTDCISTPAGQYSHMGKANPEGLCIAGYYCPINSFYSQQVPCDGGSYRKVPGAQQQSDCSACDIGFYCPRGTSTPIVCPQGYFCTISLAAPVLCPIGSYGAKVQLTKSDDCNGCPAARYCSQKGLSSPDGMCDPGYYCPINSTKSTQQICPNGGYCDAGSVTNKNCPPGRYNPDQGGRDLYACKFCDPGKSCSGTSAIAPNGGCDEGFYCPRGSKTSKEMACEPGYICPANSETPTPCGAGYYNPYYQQTACLKCPAGFYCSIVGNANTFIDCPKGYYCPELSTTPTPCTTGYYNPNKFMKALTDCLACPYGYYCTGIAQSTPSGKCSAGYWCKSGSSEQTPSAQTANWGACLPGFFCPIGSSSALPCRQGYYQDLNAQSSCKDCPIGKYCRASGLSVAEGDCFGGYVCNVTNSISPMPYNAICDAGYYCPAGNVGRAQCAAGTYQPSTKKATCIQCPAGFYCTTSGSGISAFIICPKGKYCPAGTGIAPLCNTGTYNPREGADRVEYCLSCDPGQYCGTTGLLAVTGPCTAGYYCTGGATTATQNTCGQGYYCPAGSSRPLKCPPGFYCPSTGMYDVDISPAVGDPKNYKNRPCGTGYYCLGGTILQNPTDEVASKGAKCPAGYYCPVGKPYKVPCSPGTYNPLTGSSVSTACIKCDNGYYCANYATTSISTKCNEGYYCYDTANALGSIIGFTTATPKNFVCPAGYFCQIGANKVACSTLGNYIQLQSGKSTCLKCPAGFFCSTTTSKVVCEPNKDPLNYYCPEGLNKQNCPSGYYNVVPGSSSISDCTACPPGNYCPDTPANNNTKIVPCDAGYTCDISRNQLNKSTSACPAGYYCPAQSSAGIPCPAGKYCPLGSTPASITGAGNNDCSAGYYCITKAETSQPNDGITGMPCPVGYYCPAGTISPIACSIGTYNPYPGKSLPAHCLDCPISSYCNEKALVAYKVPCPEGYYCPLNTINMKNFICLEGYYCPAGSSAMTKCPVKTFQPNKGQGSCLNCLLGSYCGTDTTITPTLCTQGKYCPESSQTPIDCPKGTFSNRFGLGSITDCEACPPGYYCPNTGMTAPQAKCTAGYYCTKSAKSATPLKDISGDICPIGYYCPTGSHLPKPCSPGTYGLTSGRTSSADCTACTQGYFCPYYGETKKSLEFGTENYKCAAGFICTGGSRTATPMPPYVTGRLCNPGFYCPKGSYIDRECPVGTYNPDYGQSSCIECPSGYICNAIQLTSVTVICTVGNYCPPKTIVPIPCPSGTYMPYAGARAETECIQCPPGKYCLGGSSNYDGNCAAGYVCPSGSKYDSPQSAYKFEENLPGKCPAGYKCAIGSSAPTPCEPGYYQPTAGQVTCKKCPKGKYCDEYGLASADKKCSEGHFCIEGARYSKPLLVATEGGRLCSAGYYCPEGTTREIGCPLSTYEPRTGSALCQNCPAGYYCIPPDASVDYIIDPIICPVGSYCPTKSADPLFCPSGTYGQFTGLEKSEQCRFCPPGFYCIDGKISGECDAGYYCNSGASSPTDMNKKCPSGHFCLQGCTYPTVCPDGKVRLSTGGESVADCITCPLGYFCLSGISIPYECPVGYYCELGCSKPVLCPIGTYNSYSKMVSVTSCKPCPEGYYCYETGVSDFTNYPCESGFYCTGGSNQTSCPISTYNAQIMGKSLADCLICPDGSICSTLNTINPLPCPPGSYCKAGVSKICDGGYYCPVGSSVPKNCPAAFYCPLNSSNYIKCEIGTYCPEKSASPIKCPVGTIPKGNTKNIDLGSSCKICIEGTYAKEGSLVCLGCYAGYVCKENASVPNPTDLATQKGYACPKGFYCLERTFIETPCPLGTFNPNEGAVAITNCTKCPTGTYNYLVGQYSCQICGGSSVTSANGSYCDCIGKNRIYQDASKKCICSLTYEPTVASEIEDGKSDCQPIVYQRCGENQIRNADGNCTDLKNCVYECNGGNGTRSASLGVCICEKIDNLNDVCNKDCRAAKPTITFSNGKILYQSNPIDMTLLGNKMMGNFSCNKNTGQLCNIVSLGISSSGDFSSDYNPTSLISNSASGASRRMAASSVISSPIVCVYKGDAVAFTVSKLHYPKYCRESLINSVKGFDESPFKQLESKLMGGSTVENFVYTFSFDGIAVFQDALNYSKQTIIAVMGENKKCPDDSAPIQPISYDNLLKIGVSQKDDIIVSPDWGLIFGILLIMLFGTPLFVFIIKTILGRKWFATQPKKKAYQVENLKFKFEPLLENSTLLKEDQTKPFNNFLISNKNENITDILEDKERTLKEIRKTEAKKLQHEVDPHIFSQIFNELCDYANNTEKELVNQVGTDKEKLKEAKEIVDDIRRRLESKLQNVAAKYTKEAKLEFNHDDDNVDKKVEIINDAMKEPDDEDSLIQIKPHAQQEYIQIIDNVNIQQEKKDEEGVENALQAVKQNAKDARHNDAPEIEQQLLQEIQNIDGNSKLQLMKDFENQKQRNSEILSKETQQIEDNITRRLEERNKQRQKIKEKQIQMEEKKKNIDREINNVREEEKGKHQDEIDIIEGEAEKEKAVALRKQREKHEEQWEAVMINYQSKVANEKDSNKIGKYLDKYVNDSEALRKQMEEEWKKQDDDITFQIQKRKNERLEQIKLKGKAKENEILMSFNATANKQNSPAIKKIDEKNESKLEGIERNIDTLQTEMGKIQKEINTRLSSALNSIENEYINQEKQLMPNDLPAAKESIQQQKLEYDSKHSQCKKQLDNANPSEKQRILAELADIESKLKSYKESEGQRINQLVKDRRDERRRKQIERQEAERQKAQKEKEDRAQMLNEQQTQYQKDAFEIKISTALNNIQESDLSTMIGPTIDRIIEEKQLAEFSQLLCQQLKEKSDALQRETMNIFREKVMELDIAKKLPQNSKKEKLQEAEDQIELDYIGKQYTMEMNLQEVYGKRHMDEAVAMKEKHIKEREEVLRSYVIDPDLLSILLSPQAAMTQDLELFKAETINAFQTKIKDIESKKKKIEIDNKMSEQQIHQLSKQEEKIKQRIANSEKRSEEIQKIELEKKKNDQLIELQKKGVSDEEKKRLIEDYTKELQMQIKLQEEERVRQHLIMTNQLEEKKKARQQLMQEREIQIKKIKDESAFQAKPKDSYIKEEQDDDTLNNRFAFVKAKYEPQKKIFEKVKPITGIKFKTALQTSEDSKEEGMADFYKVTSVGNDISRKDTFDFDKLIERLKRIEGTMGSIANSQFDQLMIGFKTIFEKMSILNEIKESTN